MPDSTQEMSSATFPPLLFHDGELRLVQEKDGRRWAVMLFIDGWYADKEDAEYVMEHWQEALEEMKKNA